MVFYSGVNSRQWLVEFSQSRKTLNLCLTLRVCLTHPQSFTGQHRSCTIHTCHMNHITPSPHHCTFIRYWFFPPFVRTLHFLLFQTLSIIHNSLCQVEHSPEAAANMRGHPVISCQSSPRGVGCRGSQPELIGGNPVQFQLLHTVRERFSQIHCVCYYSSHARSLTLRPAVSLCSHSPGTSILLLRPPRVWYSCNSA